MITGKQKLIELALRKLSENRFVDRNRLEETRPGAHIDQDLANSEMALATIRSYDLEGLKPQQHEQLDQ